MVLINQSPYVLVWTLEINAFNQLGDVVGHTVGGRVCSQFEYVVGRYKLKSDITATTTNMEHFVEPCDIRIILPTTPIPFCIHENSLSNIHNSIMSRNFRCLNPNPDKVLLKSFTCFSHGFLSGVNKASNDDYLCFEDFVKTRKSWSKGKREKFLQCTRDDLPYCYKTSLFIKNEMIFKSPLKAPRLINNPQQVFKSRYCSAVFCATKVLKAQFVFDSFYNKTSPYINFIWTSGMNRDEIGTQCTQIVKHLSSLGFHECYIVSTDYSKFEATQIPEIISNLGLIYKNISSGDVRTLLVELNKYISGPKKAYIDFNDDGNEDNYSKYTFNGTRSSGDASTTLGNTVLGFALAAWLLSNIPDREKKLMYLLQAGDDGTLIFPKHMFKYTTEMQCNLEKIGMKLDLIATNRFELCDYNSSILLWCQEDGVDKLHLSAKLGRLIARVGYTNKKFSKQQFGALCYQKALSMVNESKLFPGVREFYMKLVSKYSVYDQVKIDKQYQELITVGDIKPTDRTTQQLMRRYDITMDEYNLFNDVFAGFDPDKLFITDNLDFYKIRDILQKIIQIDCVLYTDQDIQSFYDEGNFEREFMDRFIKEIHSENQYIINLIQ